MKKVGIYQIRNKLNNNIYIGKSKNLSARKSQHLYYLKVGNHHSIHLQRAFDKYGGNNFIFEILLYCESFELDRYEKELIKKLKPSYNIITDVDLSMKKFILPPKTKSKMSYSAQKRDNSKRGNGLIAKVKTEGYWFKKEFNKTIEAYYTKDFINIPVLEWDYMYIDKIRYEVPPVVKESKNFLTEFLYGKSKKKSPINIRKYGFYKSKFKIIVCGRKKRINKHPVDMNPDTRQLLEFQRNECIKEWKEKFRNIKNDNKK